MKTAAAKSDRRLFFGNYIQTYTNSIGNAKIVKKERYYEISLFIF